MSNSLRNAAIFLTRAGETVFFEGAGKLQSVKNISGGKRVSRGQAPKKSQKSQKLSEFQLLFSILLLRPCESVFFGVFIDFQKLRLA